MKNEKELNSLYIELQSIENRGITIWLADEICSSFEIVHEVMLHEECTYMRDYVFDGERLKELHYDRVAGI